MSFIEKANKLHNFKYDYSKTVYTKAREKVVIICPIHGEFEQLPTSHLYGSGCSECRLENIRKEKKENNSEYIAKANKKHNFKYDYSKIDASSKADKSTIICPIHGEFEQSLSAHLLGKGCKKCANEFIGRKKTETAEKLFIEQASIVHNSKFDYSKVAYINSKAKVEITCPIHGIFTQNPNNHLSGQGCHYCKSSAPEIEILNIFPDIFSHCNRDIIKPLELDLYSEKYKLAIEYDGLMFHSNGLSSHKMFGDTPINYHLNKTKLCEEKGIQLFHIFENEWMNSTKKSIWLSIISNKLNLNIKIFARKCSIKEISPKEANEFLNLNHMQGECNASIKIGLYFSDELVSLMTFSKPRFNKNYDFELIRFCNKINTTVIGGASKLLSYFRKNYSSSIITYANRRWSQGDLYEKLGFIRVAEAKPNYFYFKTNEGILYSRMQFQKHKLEEKLENFNAELTEEQNMFLNGYRKIYDCGNLVYEYKGK